MPGPRHYGDWRDDTFTPPPDISRPASLDDNPLQLPGWTLPAWIIILGILLVWLIGCTPIGVMTDNQGFRGCLSQEYRCD